MHDRAAALGFLQHHAAKKQIVTGLLYVEKESEDLHGHLDTVAVPLNSLGEKELCPGQAALDKFNATRCARRHFPHATPESSADPA